MVLNIVLNDFFECLRFSCVYNKGSEIISVVVYILKIYVYFVVSDAICRLSTFILDSRLFYSWLSIFLLSTFLLTLDSRLLLSTLDFTLDSRQLLSTLDPELLDTLIKFASKHDSYSNRTVGFRIIISIYIFASEWLPFQKANVML